MDEQCRELAGRVAGLNASESRFAELVRDTSNDPHLVAEAERLLGAGRAVQDDGLRDELAERLTRISDEGYGEWHDRVLPNGAGDSWACVPIRRVIEVMDEVLAVPAVQAAGEETHSAARHVGHVLGLLPSGQLVCDQCEVELGAVQDDGLPTVEALAEAVHRVICPFHRPGPSHMDHGPDHFDDEHATAILTHLRAAPPLHDPSGDER